MATPFIGEIRGFSFSFAPRGWALCNGQLLPINTNQALFSLLGTTYGGNGTTTFALPDLRGRVAINVGGNYTLGESAGTETVTLQTTQLPTHTHAINAAANGTTNATNVPGPTVILGSGSTDQTGTPPAPIYGTGSVVALAPLGAPGAAQPHENRMPSLVVSYCIAISGVYPSRT
jgi:microcystin-dependent protein